MEWLILTEYETGELCLFEEDSIVAVVPLAPTDQHGSRTRVETRGIHGACARVV